MLLCTEVPRWARQEHNEDRAGRQETVLTHRLRTVGAPMLWQTSTLPLVELFEK